MKHSLQAFFRPLCSVLIVLAHSVLVMAQDARQLAQKTFPSVVLIVTQDANGEPLALASGFFVHEGVVATNFHVIQGAAAGRVKLVGQSETYPIDGVVAIDGENDIALLKVSAGKPPALRLSDGSDVVVGEEVYAVGNPEGLEGTFSQGIVSGIRRSGSDRLLQITAPISPGSSGGPIIDSRGAVIGIATATFMEGQNLNFAIPSSYVVALLNRIGEVRPLSAIKDQQGNSETFKHIIGQQGGGGVVGTAFSWTATARYPTVATGVSFSLLNQTGSPVKDIRFLIVFSKRDDEHGYEPFDYIEAETCPDVVIRPGLPKRLTEFWTKSSFGDFSSCSEFVVDWSVVSRSEKEEIRVLDFRFAE